MRCGFVTYLYHESAEAAILGLNGSLVCGVLVRLSWGNSNGYPYVYMPVYDPGYYDVGGYVQDEGYHVQEEGYPPDLVEEDVKCKTL